MPSEIASVDLAEVCELGCKHYVEHFTEYLLPGEMQKAMKGPRVLVHDDHWQEVLRRPDKEWSVHYSLQVSGPPH